MSTKDIVKYCSPEKADQSIYSQKLHMFMDENLNQLFKEREKFAITCCMDPESSN